jgi:hypothetical protein
MYGPDGKFDEAKCKAVCGAKMEGPCMKDCKQGCKTAEECAKSCGEACVNSHKAAKPCCGEEEGSEAGEHHHEHE